MHTQGHAPIQTTELLCKTRGRSPSGACSKHGNVTSRRLLLREGLPRKQALRLEQVLHPPLRGRHTHCHTHGASKTHGRCTVKHTERLHFGRKRTRKDMARTDRNVD